MRKAGDLFEVISLYDRAIDNEASDPARYAATLDTAHIKAKPGHRLTLVRAKLLDDAAFCELGDAYSDKAARLETFERCAVSASCDGVDVRPDEIPVGARLDMGLSIYRAHVEIGLDPT